MTARARRPAETPGIPAETPRHARETRVTCRVETPDLPGAETRGIPAAKARHPGGKRVAWRGVNAQIIVRQTITRQVSAPWAESAAGWPSQPLNARRAAGRGSVSGLP